MGHRYRRHLGHWRLLLVVHRCGRVRVRVRIGVGASKACAGQLSAARAAEREGAGVLVATVRARHCSQHISTSTHQHINTSTHQHINTLLDMRRRVGNQRQTGGSVQPSAADRHARIGVARPTIEVCRRRLIGGTHRSGVGSEQHCHRIIVVIVIVVVLIVWSVSVVVQRHRCHDSAGSSGAHAIHKHHTRDDAHH